MLLPLTPKSHASTLENVSFLNTVEMGKSFTFFVPILPLRIKILALPQQANLSKAADLHIFLSKATSDA